MKKQELGSKNSEGTGSENIPKRYFRSRGYTEAGSEEVMEGGVEKSEGRDFEGSMRKQRGSWNGLSCGGAFMDIHTCRNLDCTLKTNMLSVLYTNHT